MFEKWSLTEHFYDIGHVYTRMVYKAACAFGTLKEWDTELSVLGELLEQTHWRKGKRATWYERRAVIQDRYIKPDDFEVVRSGILEALADEFTGIGTFLTCPSDIMSWVPHTSNGS